jgi:signal transduction histidine kinase
MVPQVADWAAVHVSGGPEETVAVAHAGGKEDRGWELLRRYPPDPNLPHGYPYVIRTGQPDLVPDVTPTILREVAVDDEHVRLLTEIGLTSWLCLPLTIRGETYGAVSLAMAESRRRFSSDDVERMLEVARRCSTAIENARLYQLAQEAIELREEFLSVAAHELRTPIAAILLTLFGVQRQAQEAKLEVLVAKVSHIIQQFDRLTALVDRLLDVSRIRAGKMEIKPEPCDLAKLVRDVAARYSEAATRAGCALTVHTPEAAPGSWDPVRLEQVLNNLLGNAIKFCAKTPIEVVLTANDSGVALSVRDHGLGIAPERLPHIFERFERGVSARNYGGLGLGLYVSRQIVDAHGGRIDVESAVGQGTTFRVRLPRHPPPLD